jgi:hypothetical protein
MLRSMAEITRVVVQYQAEDGSSRHVTLKGMRRHCRPERIEDLLDDLVVLCEDVVDGLHPLAPRRPLSVVREQRRGG